MRRASLALLLTSACGLFPSLDGLSSDAGGGSDAITDASQKVDAADASDAAQVPDVDAGKPTFIRAMTIKNNASQPLPVGYTMAVAFPDAQLQAAISGGKMRSDLNDLRVRGPSNERDRIVDPADKLQAGSRVVWFSLSAQIAGGATDTTYAITYGVPNDPAPPGDGTTIFAFYDDFNGTSVDPKWMTQGTMNVGGGMLTLPKSGLGALTTLSQAPISTAEMRVRITDPQSAPDPNTNFYYWFGYQHTGDFIASEPWAIWIARGKGTIGAEEQANGCPSNCVGATTAQTTAFRYYAIERQAAQSIFSVDGAPQYTTAVTNDQALSVMIRNYLVTGDVIVDWVRSRTRIYPEPTVTLGAEQAQ